MTQQPTTRNPYDAKLTSTTLQAALGSALLRPRPLSFLFLLLLSLQFVLGIITNLYVHVPTNHPGSNAPEYFSGVVQGIGWAITHGALSLQLHVILGLLLLVTSFAHVWVAYTTGGRAWKIITPLSVVGVLGAAFNGASFINYGHDFSSLIMALGFFIALVANMVGLYITQ